MNGHRMEGNSDYLCLKWAVMADPETSSVIIYTPVPGQSPRLAARVVDLAEEVGVVVLRGVAVLAQPPAQDEEVPREEDAQEAEVVDAEPLVGPLRGQGGGGGEERREDARGRGGDRLGDRRLAGGGQGRLHDVGGLRRHEGRGGGEQGQKGKDRLHHGGIGGKVEDEQRKCESGVAWGGGGRGRG